jgi:hypothetical protein
VTKFLLITLEYGFFEIFHELLFTTMLKIE